MHFGFHCSKDNFPFKEIKIRGDWLKLMWKAELPFQGNAPQMKKALAAGERGASRGIPANTL